MKKETTLVLFYTFFSKERYPRRLFKNSVNKCFSFNKRNEYLMWHLFKNLSVNKTLCYVI